MRSCRLAGLPISIALMFAGPGPLAANEQAKRSLIIHADDAGMSHSANRATIYAMEQGIVSSASIMVPCAWFAEMAEYARQHPKRDFGIHLTLTSEWRLYRWGPVAPQDRVPSLVDDRGFLWSNVAQVAKHAKTDEVEIELRAQIERARQFGVPITHLDTHMGSLACRADLAQLYVRLGIEYQIPILFPRQLPEEVLKNVPELREHAQKVVQSLQANHLPLVDYLDYGLEGRDFEARKADCLQKLAELKPGVTQLIIHCGYEDEELKAITNSHAQRDSDRRIFADPEVIAAVRKAGIEVVGWKDLHR